MVQNTELIPQAITLKSSKNYPQNREHEYKSLYYDDIHDFNLANNINSNKALLNQKPVNQSHMLNRRPDGNIEDINYVQAIINSIEPLNNVKNDLILQNNLNAHSINNLGYNTDKNIFDNITKCSSFFSYIDKDMVLLNKEIDEGRESLLVNNANNSILNNFLSTKQNKQIKMPQEAPKSITEQRQATAYKKSKNVIRKNTQAANDIDFKIPENINLPQVSNFEVKKDFEFNYFDENNNMDDNDMNNFDQDIIKGDDIDIYQTPLDLIKYKNSQILNSIKSSTVSFTNSNINSSRNISTSSINNNISNQNKNTFQNNNYNSNNNISNQVIEQNIQQNVGKTITIPSPPKVPTAPPVPKVPKIPAAPKIPVAPPVPKIVPKTPTSVNINENKAEDKTLVSGEARGNLLDEIKSDNPMARLKKINTVANIKRPTIEEKPKADDASSNLSNVSFNFLF